MNSITSNYRPMASNAPPDLDYALHRLGGWLDAERDTLIRVLLQAGRRLAISALEALEQLHLEPCAKPEDLWTLLADAKVHLEYLLETLRGIPLSCPLETAYGLPGPDAFAMHICWSGARLQEIFQTVHNALTA